MAPLARSLALLSALLIAPLPLQSQEAEWSTRRFSVSLFAGGAVGVSSDLPDAMAAVGFGRDQQCSSFWSSSGIVEYPETESSTGLTVTARYRLSGWLSVGVMYVEGSTIAETRGNRDGFQPHVEPLVQSVAAMASFRLPGALRIGAGPALHRIQIQGRGSGLPSGRTHRQTDKSNLGAVAELGLEWPRDTRLFLDLTAQYRFVGDASVGGFDVEQFGREKRMRFPGADFSLNHGILAVGFGVRF